MRVRLSLKKSISPLAHKPLHRELSDTFGKYDELREHSKAKQAADEAPSGLPPRTP
jgi:hypothetical protein